LIKFEEIISFAIVCVVKPQPCKQGFGLNPGCAPGGGASALGVFALGLLYASPPYGTQRMDFAWPFDVPVADPIRGRAVLTRATDDLCIPLPPAVPCVYPAVRLQSFGAGSITWHPSLRFSAAMSN
jgi:hypothetical protein